MDIQNLYFNGISFDEFILSDDGSYKDKSLNIYNNININDDLMNRIMTIDRKINILAFAEIWCPDSVINLPALKKLCDLNENIQMKIVPREGNELYLEDYKVKGKSKMPTFLFMDEDFNVINTFVEIPKVIAEIALNGNKIDIMVAKRKYRKGEFSKETIEEIINKIT